MSKVYIAGPMRGIKDFNFPAFYAAELEVLDLVARNPKPSGWHESLLSTGRFNELGGGLIWDDACSVTIFNPARRDHDTYGPDVNKSETGDLSDLPDFDLREALGADLAWIAAEATHIYMLDGWEKSKGATAERATALALGLEVLYQTPPPDLLNEAYLKGYAAAVETGKPEDWADVKIEPTVVDVLNMTPVGWYGSFTDKDGNNKFMSGDFGTSETRVTSLTGGEKGSKIARYDLIPAGPLNTLASLYGKGAEKYADRNWERGYDWSLSFAAMQRHAWAFWSGQDNYPEHGLPHLASVAWHALALMEWNTTHPEFDNRPKG